MILVRDVCHQLIPDVAAHLSGNRIHLVSFRPMGENTLGQCGKTQDGIVIFLNREMTNERQVMSVFLHEIAHAKLHMAERSPATMQKLIETANEPYKMITGDGTIAGEVVAAMFEYMESQADELAAKWLEYATNRASHFQGWLEALLTWRD